MLTRDETTVRGVAESLVRLVWTYVNERWYGVSTRSQGEHVGAPDSVPYDTPDYFLLRRTAAFLRPYVRPSDVFFELGCGKGRVLAVMSRLPFARLVGIELDPRLAQTARENSTRLRGQHAPIDVVCGNVLEAALDDGTFFFLFNPFGRQTTGDVVNRLRDSVARRPRRVFVAYHNAAYASLFDEAGFLERIHRFRTPGGLDVVFWRSRAAPTR
jgi:SAM-dependent methyltransferase